MSTKGASAAWIVNPVYHRDGFGARRAHISEHILQCRAAEVAQVALTIVEQHIAKFVAAVHAPFQKQAYAVRDNGILADVARKDFDAGHPRTPLFVVRAEALQKRAVATLIQCWLVGVKVPLFQALATGIEALDVEGRAAVSGVPRETAIGMGGPGEKKRKDCGDGLHGHGEPSAPVVSHFPLNGLLTRRRLTAERRSMISIARKPREIISGISEMSSFGVSGDTFNSISSVVTSSICVI